MINSVSPQIGPLSNYYNGIGNSSKIEVPVPSSVIVYAQLKYVRGVPASSEQQPVSLSRAQIIDNMVAYLNSNTDEYSLDKNAVFEINELETEIHRLVNEKPINFQFLSNNMDTGLIFDLSV